MTNEKAYCKTCGLELVDGKHDCKGLWDPNEPKVMVFKIKDSTESLHFKKNNDYYNQWRKQFNEYSMEFLTTAMLAAADIIRERNSLYMKNEEEKKKKSDQNGK